jgi:hypothetical protein
MRILLSQTLSKRMPANNLPKGMKQEKLAPNDLNRIKGYWLKREVRSDASWDLFLKTYDTTRSFSVDARSRGVELPLTIESKGRENIVILFQTGDLKKAAASSLATLTLVQTTTQGSIVGGSTFVLKSPNLG